MNQIRQINFRIELRTLIELVWFIANHIPHTHMMSSSLTQAKKPKLEITNTNPNWIELSKDVTSNILQRLGAVEILTNTRNVCPYWWNVCKPLHVFIYLFFLIHNF